MRLSVLVLASLAAVAGPGELLAEPSAGPAPLSGEPPLQAVFTHAFHQWDDLGPVGPYYPERAVRMHQEGESVILCKLTVKSQLTDCSIVSESPAGFDFGNAALMLAKRGVVTANPGTPDGATPVEMTVQVVVPFTFRRWPPRLP